MTGEVVAILKVRDVAASLDWYRRAGFAVRGFEPQNTPTWAEVERDGLALQLLGGDTPWEGEPGFTGCFYVRPPSVRAVHAELDGVVELPWGLEEREWGAVELVVHDPDGYAITFTGDA